MPTDGEKYIYVGNGNWALVKAVRVFRFRLDYDLYLVLHETFVVPSFGWNLISTSFFDKYGYYCSFGYKIFIVLLNLNIVSTSIFVDKLYKLYNRNIDSNVNLHTSNYGTKRQLTYENSPML